MSEDGILLAFFTLVFRAVVSHEGAFGFERKITADLSRAETSLNTGRNITGACHVWWNHIIDRIGDIVAWGAARVASQPGLGLLPQWRNRVDFVDFADPASDGQNLSASGHLISPYRSFRKQCL